MMIFLSANKTWQNILTIKLGYGIVDLQTKLGKDDDHGQRRNITQKQE